ncbi:hypothetical protein YTPLAS18_40320 [Nitrospira sp.]|nr:hypothetical protein YTPLAS18_40320 [Nitrospira sp.]
MPTAAIIPHPQYEPVLGSRHQGFQGTYERDDFGFRRYYAVLNRASNPVARNQWGSGIAQKPRRAPGSILDPEGTYRARGYPAENGRQARSNGGLGRPLAGGGAGDLSWSGGASGSDQEEHAHSEGSKAHEVPVRPDELASGSRGKGAAARYPACQGECAAEADGWQGGAA